MKIAILVSMFPPKWIGGTEIATQNIARYLVKRGNEVHILTFQDKDLIKETKKEGVYIHRIFYPKIKFFGVLIFWIKLFFGIRKINPDIIHSQSIQMAMPCLLAKKIFGIPYLIYCHGSDVYSPWRFKKLISSSVLKNADAVIVLTQDMKEQIQKIYNREVFIIPNGVDIQEFENFSQYDIRKKLQIKKNAKIILFIGTLKTVKGIEYLIRAVNIIKDKIPETQLLIIGDGEDNKNLKALVEKLNLENSIIFVGKVRNEMIPEYMKVANIFVLPSLSEGLPLVILEAMAAGLPIVATRVGGVPEIVKDGENGFLVEPKNSQEIAEKVLYLLSNHDIKNSISVRNKTTAKKFSWGLISNEIIKVYNLCLNRK